MKAKKAGSKSEMAGSVPVQLCNTCKTAYVDRRRKQCCKQPLAEIGWMEKANKTNAHLSPNERKEVE